ncbi:MAG: transglycosylase SLT domain-containing protein [Burkholderiales bacterium]|nr:transglycosylase SLT domain-containing protein [Burkholderiales bacterium]
MTLAPRAALASLLLWLAGCATTGSPTAGDTAPAAAATPPVTSAATPRLPAVYPAGPLAPIQASEAASRAVMQLQPPPDLWERIRRGFAMNNLEGDLVRTHEQWYSSRPDYIQRMTERSSKYLFHIVEELERRNMPAELALLPFIESAFNPQAVSSAKAAGMWQFMPATGTYFDLKQNVFRDDRRDVLASTRAALDYLQKLYNMFGEWDLALAAYNWGEGSVSRAIARNKKLGLGTSYVELNMPAETRSYVPKLQAVKNIVADPARFGNQLPVIENHPYFQSVEITRDIDVELAARLADVTVADFRALNPSARQPVILAAGTPQILLPWDNAEVFKRNALAYADGQYASWTAWTVPTNMSAAAAAQRVGMSEADLRSANSIPPRMLIRAGSTLIVPRTAKMQQDVASHIADNAQLSLTPENITRRTLVKAGKKDSVATIARRYKLSAANVAEWNDVGRNAAFKAGQQVVVYLPVRAAAASKSAASKSASRSTAAKKQPTKSQRGGTPSKKKR